MSGGADELGKGQGGEGGHRPMCVSVCVCVCVWRGGILLWGCLMWVVEGRGANVLHQEGWGGEAGFVVG